MNLNWSLSHITPQDIQTISIILSALGVTSMIAAWRVSIGHSIARFYNYLFHADQIAKQNQDLAAQARTLEQKLRFVESSRDDFKGFVEDLSDRLDHLSVELDAAKAQLSHVKSLLEEERNAVEKIEAQRETALVWGRQLLRQLKTLGEVPISEEPTFANVVQTIIITKENEIK